jgi:hypothetical protein
VLLTSAAGTVLGYHDRGQERAATVSQVASASRRLWRDRHFWRLATAGVGLGGAVWNF